VVSLNAYTMSANVENLAFNGAGNFSGTGNALDNIMSGGAGNDTLSGAGGNDTLNGLAGTDNLNGGAGADLMDGGTGADTMAGGAGDDRYVVDNAGDVVTEAAGAGADAVMTTLAAYTLGADVENLAFTGAGSFAGTGNALANGITGGAGNDNLQGLAGSDTLSGGAGNDTLDGGAGADTMAGGAGDDRYFVANAGDLVNEAAGAGTDAVMVSLNTYAMTANVENLLFTGAGNFVGTGNALANAMTGAAGADTLSGGDGNDVLNGLAGADTLNGGAGADTLNGGDGNDRLTGGAGNDTLDGGAGSDVFVFFPAGFGNDRINGFDANPAGGQDLMDISGLGIRAATFAANVQLIGSAAGTTVAIGADTIMLTGINAATIDASDFLLAA
jgi:Ca2+-binding RTX toxin-like protein